MLSNQYPMILEVNHRKRAPKPTSGNSNNSWAKGEMIMENAKDINQTITEAVGTNSHGMLAK